MSMSRSIYSSNGKPLSQQALYQQKLKQGVYSSPNIANVGVNSSASDTAALLAASTDLTVKPSYERTVAHEAQEAALAAKLQKVYEWSRTVDENATSAASAGLKGYNTKQSESFNSSTPTYKSSASELGVGKLNGTSIYATANKNSTSTMTSRINPEKNSKHGLLPKEASKTFDIGKISSLANSNSTKTMDSRINPSSSAKRSGLVQNNGENRTKSFQASDISGKFLLSAASERANTRLNSLATVKNPDDFKKQAQQYAGALAIAQKRSEERVAENKKGLIDLGGGLTVSPAELDAMAALIVKPVLSDIDSKAKLQRDTDEVNRKKKVELAKQHEQAKREEQAAKEKEKADLEAAKQDRISKNTVAKAEKDTEYSEYQKVEEAKVAAKLAELKEQEEKFAAAKEELLVKKQENQDKIDNEEQELISSRKTVLDGMQEERDEEIAPLLEELKTETGKLEELTNAKNELDDEVKKLTTLNEEYTTKSTGLEQELAGVEEGIETSTKELEEKEAELTTITKEVEDLSKSTEAELGELGDEDTKLDGEVKALTETKAKHLDDKTSQKEQIKAQLAERVEEEHAINGELPEHLRKDVNEKKLLDTASIFSDEPAPIETKPEPVKEPAVAPAKETKKIKQSRIKRLSNFFKPSKGSSAAKPVAKPTKPITKPASVKDEGKSVKSVASHSYEGYEDQTSVAQKNKGGLFKEEI